LERETSLKNDEPRLQGEMGLLLGYGQNLLD
jgi:hypothetical protein